MKHSLSVGCMTALSSGIHTHWFYSLEAGSDLVVNSKPKRRASAFRTIDNTLSTWRLLSQSNARPRNTNSHFWRNIANSIGAIILNPNFELSYLQYIWWTSIHFCQRKFETCWKMLAGLVSGDIIFTNWYFQRPADPSISMRLVDKEQKKFETLRNRTKLIIQMFRTRSQVYRLRPW